MKSIKEFRVITEEHQDFSKFDALVRAGLANKSQIQRLHKILGKMSEEKPNFSSVERELVQGMFVKMVDLLVNNPQINRQARKSVAEGTIVSSDYKMSVTGKKVKAHRNKIAESTSSEPPNILLLKRTAIRLYPNGLRVAMYHSRTLNKEFAIPFGDNTGTITTEEHTIEFANGESISIDEDTLNIINRTEDLLNEDNKQKFVEMLHSNHDNFRTALEFAKSVIDENN